MAGSLSANAIAINSTGSGLGSGTTDPNWTYSPPYGNSTLTGQAVVLSPGNYFSGWTTSDPNAKWISTCDAIATLSCIESTPNNPVVVTYSTTFNLTGLDPSTAVLNIQYTGDDTLGAVRLNGVTEQDLNAGGLWGSLNSLTINSGFIAGLNTLSFDVTNTDNFYEGILVDVTGTAAPISSSGPPVPEPATFGLISAAFAGVIASRRFSKA